MDGVGVNKDTEREEMSRFSRKIRSIDDFSPEVYKLYVSWTHWEKVGEGGWVANICVPFKLLIGDRKWKCGKLTV